MSDKSQIVKLTWPVVTGLMLAEAFTLVLVIGFFWFLTHAIPGNAGDVRAVLNEQAAAWNRGDLEGYMAGYWNDPALRFYSGGKITLGWQPTLDRYRQRYQGDGRAMGHLTFADVDVSFIADDAALARGRWRLDMPDGKIDEGLFTLLLRRIHNEWKIIHDHSSISTPPDKP